MEENNNNFNNYNNYNYNNGQNVNYYPNTPYPPYNPYVVQQDPEELKEKKAIRKIGLAIGLPSLALFGISYAWPFVYLFITTECLKMSYNEAEDIIYNPAIQQVLQIILSSLMFLLPFTIAAKCLKVKIGELVMFNKAKKGTFLPFLLIGMGFCSFANIATSYASSFFEGFGVDYEVNFGKNPEGIYGFLLSFIATAIVPALVEEFACRGIILGLLKKYGEGFAIISSAVIFGIMHGNFEQIPFATMVGLILGYIYVKTGSIWTCIAVHCINNSISVIFTYLQDVVSVNTQNILYIIYLILSMIFAIIGVWLFSKNTDENYNLEKGEGKITLKQKYNFLFTSWAIIIFICLNIIEALSYFEFFKPIIYVIIESLGL